MCNIITVMANKITLEDRKVFQENVASSWVEWNTSFRNFKDYIESMEKDEEVDEFGMAIEIRKCSELLLTKKIDPKGISMSFCKHLISSYISRKKRYWLVYISNGKSKLHIMK